MKIQLPNGRYLVLQDVLYITDMKNTLISATKILNSDGATFKNSVFTQNKCEIQVGKQVIAKATLSDNTRLYLLDGKIIHVPEDEEDETEDEAANVATEDLWRLRMGHTPIEKLNKMKNAVEGLPSLPLTQMKVCEGCARGKPT